jgi:hypothetical protein
MNFNIQPLQKPTVLTELIHAKLKLFKSQFRHYYGDTKGTATLSGHVSDQMVSAIDTALGGKKVYAHLLGHGPHVNVSDLSEDVRETYPWLHKSNNWEAIIEALLIIKPEGGNYNVKSYEQCMAAAEEAHLAFALRVEHSGEDEYYYKLMEDAKRCELAKATPAQKKAYFNLLITGSRIRGNNYRGFDVGPKSLDKAADRGRVDVLRTQALLQLSEFTSTRKFCDFIIEYLDKLRNVMSAAKTFQGGDYGSGQGRDKEEEEREEKSDSWKERRGKDKKEKESKSTGGPSGTTVGPTSGSYMGPRDSVDPCPGCGANDRHKTETKGALTRDRCPFKRHPDFNSAQCSWYDSATAKNIIEQKVVHISKKGTVNPSGSLMMRLNPHYRAILVDGKHVKLENSIRDGDRGSYTRTPSAPHLCCSTCNTSTQRDTCLNTCVECKDMLYMTNLYTLWHDTLTPIDTSPALISAVLKQEEATEEVEIAMGATNPRIKIKPAGPTTSLTPQAKVSETQVFLDSGCLGSSYIREDIAHAIAKHKPHLFIPCVTNVCGAFGQCELSKKKMFVKLSMICNDVNKVFITELKVLKNLPYEIILGRTVMQEHNLTLGQGALTGTSRVPNIATMKGGQTQPDLHTQTEAATTGVRLGTHLDSLTSIRPVHARGPRNRSRASKQVTEGPTVVQQVTRIPLCSPCNNVQHTQPATRIGHVESEQVLMGEPIRDDTGQINTSCPPCNYSSRMSNPTWKAFDRLSDLVKLIRIPTRTKNRRRLKRRCGKQKLALISADRASRKLTPPKVDGKAITITRLCEGNLLLRYLTDPAGRDVTVSRLIPAPLKRRQLIGAVMRLKLEVENGKVLAPDIPAVHTQVGVSSEDEHMNVMRDYQVELHSKLVQSEENRAHMSTLINFEQEADGMEGLEEYDPSYLEPHECPTHNPASTRPGHEGPTVSSSCYIPPDIRGDEVVMKNGQTLKQSLTDVCNSLKRVFNTKVHPTPALVTPMKLEVDVKVWEDRANAAAPRQHSAVKHAEVLKQVEKMLPLEVIRESQAPYYSQVHLTPKPTPGEWRFCIDFRRLNMACKSMGWPIPNIADMLQRLGAKRPKYFCKLDLTAGYHQAPLDEESRKYTAFRTAHGLYEWQRVPMGLKGAPSYFQQVMQTEVLHGLLYRICELYIDDIIIFADSEEELVQNLKAVLERLLHHNITVSPEKCSFGLTEVEFVGHTVDHEGLHFSREKLDKVLQIDRPTTSKQLKSFLGVTVYFSDHVYHYAELVKPLHRMLTAYDAKKKIVWTEDTEKAFYAVQRAVNECPKVYFSDPTQPIYVATDASDYGIGAICYQVMDGKVVPIAFMSRSLTAQECNWTTTEKECFAIVYALRKFEYLIRDCHFTLLTDHQNLIYIDSETSQKVKRWKLSIQCYDFDIHHIAGRLNVIADGFSRILPVPKELVMWMRTEAHTGFAGNAIARGFADVQPLEEEAAMWMSEYTIPAQAEKVLRAHHNEVVGHHGAQRTYEHIVTDRVGPRGETILGQSPWPNMREHIKRFIRRCPCCQKMSNLSVPIQTHLFTTASTQPFERTNMDRIGPLPESNSGNKFVLVLIDCFTRWVTLYPLKDGTMEGARGALLWHVGHFVAPSQVIHDGGTEFTNGSVKELFAMCGIENTTTLAYSKEENGMVERANKEVMRHLRNILFHTNLVGSWEDHLGPVMHIMNNQKRGSSFPSPARLLFGDSVCTDAALFLPPGAVFADGAQVVLSAWADNMIKQQKTINAIAAEIQYTKDRDHMALQTTPPTKFAVGSYVLAKYPSTDGVVTHRGPPNKLLPFLRGPMRVIGHLIDTDKYTIRSLITHRDEDIHVSQLRAFIHATDATLVSLQTYARRDHQNAFVVQSIQGHRGEGYKRRLMEFLVRWEGFGPQADSWEPYSEIRDSGPLHTYLFAQPQRKFHTLVPRKFFVNGVYLPEADA